MAERSNMILTVPSRAAAIASPERVCLMKPPIDLPGFDVKQYWHERFDSEPGNIWLRAHIARIRQVEARTACHRSEEHTSELQSLMRISYAVFCLKKKKKNIITTSNHQTKTLKHNTNERPTQTSN